MPGSDLRKFYAIREVDLEGADRRKVEIGDAAQFTILDRDAPCDMRLGSSEAPALDAAPGTYGLDAQTRGRGESIDYLFFSSEQAEAGDVLRLIVSRGVFATVVGDRFSGAVPAALPFILGSGDAFVDQDAIVPPSQNLMASELDVSDIARVSVRFLLDPGGSSDRLDAIRALSRDVGGSIIDDTGTVALAGALQHSEPLIISESSVTLEVYASHDNASGAGADRTVSYEITATPR